MKNTANQSGQTMPGIITETPLAGGDLHQTGPILTKPDLLKLKSSEATAPNSGSVSSIRRARRSARTRDLAASINSIFGWHRHPRNGKVARLPEAIRNQINRMIEDGMMYRTILAKL